MNLRLHRSHFLWGFLILEVMLVLMILMGIQPLLSQQTPPGIAVFQAHSILVQALMEDRAVEGMSDYQSLNDTYSKAFSHQGFTLHITSIIPGLQPEEDFQISATGQRIYSWTMANKVLLTISYTDPLPSRTWLPVIILAFLLHTLGLLLLLSQMLQSFRIPLFRIFEGIRRLEKWDLKQLSTGQYSDDWEEIVSAFNRAVSQVKQRLDVLESRSQELLSILDHMSDGVIVSDHRGTILIMNQAAKSSLIPTPLAHVPATLQLLGSTGIIELFEESRNSNETRHSRIIMYQSDHERIYETAAQALTLDGSSPSSERVIFLLHEVTQLTRLENIRSDFVANVSHELKTPITSILGFIETLLSEDEIDQDRQKHFLKIILRQSNRLKNIIEDLLALSRLEQTGTNISYTSCDPKSIIQSAVETAEHQAQERGIGIQIIQPEFTSTIEVNEALLEQALINLIENGIKYGHPNGWIKVSWEIVNDYCIFSVQDNGPGIPAREQHQIFQRFYRIDKARSRQQGGTGLGLAIVKHIARSHGGETRVTSILGQGSTFSLHIPCRPPRE